MSRQDPLRVAAVHLSRAQRWSVGQAVTVTLDDESTLDTVTRSEPWRLGGTWVILLAGISGGYALARVSERSETL